MIVWEKYFQRYKLFYIEYKKELLLSCKNRLSNLKKALDNEALNMLLYILSVKYADVAELADALVLGTSVIDVGVQVPSSAPMTYMFELIEQIHKNIILKKE